MTAIAVAFLLCGVAAFAATPPQKHEITSLPGVDTLPSKMYTGYIDAGKPPSGVGTMYFHYWMVESEGNPDTDPIIFWYNGGPGASSLFGLLQEFGPLLLNENSYDEKFNKTGIPTPQPNPASWTKVATVVAIDSPPPIGFSYCTQYGPAGEGPSCGPWTDKSVFAANHAAHKTFFNVLFPERKTNPFFIIGESYAGVYVPGFVKALLDDPIPGLNFQGFAVGDGYIGCPVVPGKPVAWCTNLDNVGLFKYPNVLPGPWYDIEFFHGHMQFSNELYRTIMTTCPEEGLRNGTLSDECWKLIDQMSEEVGGWFAYNLYNTCPVNELRHGMNKALHARRLALRATQVGGIPGSSPCPGKAMPDWLLRNDTLTALGAPLDTNFLNLDNGHGFNYTTDQSDIRFIYKEAIAKGLRVLVYEGDTDACGLSTSPVEDAFVEYFTQQKYPKTGSWRPWTTDGKQQMGGYVIEWLSGQARFVSIRGAGHLVPLNRPVVSLELLRHFTENTKLPEYRK